MIKDIEQIQEENRKLILEAVEPDGFYEESINENPILRNWKITLSRVLLALGNKVLFCEGYLCEHLVTDDGLIMTTNHIQWDLQKETLEEQSEETQIAINQLLTK